MWWCQCGCTALWLAGTRRHKNGALGALWCPGPVHAPPITPFHKYRDYTSVPRIHDNNVSRYCLFGLCMRFHCSLYQAPSLLCHQEWLRPQLHSLLSDEAAIDSVHDPTRTCDWMSCVDRRRKEKQDMTSSYYQFIRVCSAQILKITVHRSSPVPSTPSIPLASTARHAFDLDQTASPRENPPPTACQGLRSSGLGGTGAAARPWP